MMQNRLLSRLFDGQLLVHYHVIWTMITIFLDMLNDCLEYYVDDILVKSREVYHNDLKKVFERCRQYKNRMNSFKMCF